jgi:hypothetical protein
LQEHLGDQPAAGQLAPAQEVPPPEAAAGGAPPDGGAAGAGAPMPGM